jgi:hypothetical protein
MGADGYNGLAIRATTGFAGGASVQVVVLGEAIEASLAYLGDRQHTAPSALVGHYNFLHLAAGAAVVGQRMGAP